MIRKLEVTVRLRVFNNCWLQAVGVLRDERELGS